MNATSRCFHRGCRRSRTGKTLKGDGPGRSWPDTDGGDAVEMMATDQDAHSIDAVGRQELVGRMDVAVGKAKGVPRLSPWITFPRWRSASPEVGIGLFRRPLGTSHGQGTAHHDPAHCTASHYADGKTRAAQWT